MGNTVDYPDYFFEQPPRQPQQSTKPPPASTRIVSALPSVKVTGDDLLEETNKECLICLEEQKIGSVSCKLPCGHLFHKRCVTEWLEKQCTCPVCRFELETDDQGYERVRQQKMKDRKLRMRMDELKKKSIVQLRNICKQLDIAIHDCIDKQEIIERIQRSRKVIFTEVVPPMEMSEEEFNKKNVGELKHLLLSFGLPTEGALEKSELRGRLQDSGRVVIITPAHIDTTIDSQETKMEIDNNNNVPYSCEKGPTVSSLDNNNYTNNTCTTNNTTDSISDSNYRSTDTSERTNPPSSPYVTSSSSSSRSSSRRDYSPEQCVSIFKAMSLSQLRQICREYRVNTNGCIDKSEVIEKILQCTKLDNILLSYGPSQQDDDVNLSRQTNTTATGEQQQQQEENCRSHSPSNNSYDTTDRHSPTATHITAEDYIDQNDSRMMLSHELIDSLSIEELLMILASCNIPIRSGMTREQIVTLLQQCPQVLVVP